MLLWLIPVKIGVSHAIAIWEESFRQGMNPGFIVGSGEQSFFQADNFDGLEGRILWVGGG
jgi:hypothetical protein